MYKTIKGIAHALAIAAVQNEALIAQHKWIEAAAFGAAEKLQADKIAAAIDSILSHADGRRWYGTSWQDHDNVFDGLIAACHGLHIGFRAQDDIRATLAHCGIKTVLD